MPEFGAYQIIVNGKSYVGSTSVSFSKRKRNHLCLLRKGIHDNKRLQQAFSEHGENSLSFIILEVARTRDEALSLEQKYIDLLKPEFNVHPNARSPLGSKLTEEHKQHISAGLKGHIVTEITKQKIGKLNKGLIPWSKGKRLSDETRKKMSKTNSRKPSEVTKKKLSEANKGKSPWCKGGKLSEEHKRKISMAMKGNKNWKGSEVETYIIAK